MQPKVIMPQAPMLDIGGGARVRTTVSKYVPAKWSGVNTSGIEPIGARVLVLVDKPEERTLGGVELPADFVQRAGMSAETGVLVAVGEGAFVYAEDRMHSWTGRRPAAGDRVVIERYSGQLQMGADGEIYRLMEARNVGGVVAPTAEATETAQ